MTGTTTAQKLPLIIIDERPTQPALYQGQRGPDRRACQSCRIWIVSDSFRETLYPLLARLHGLVGSTSVYLLPHLVAHLLLVTGAHLCRNPRVVKEASALTQAGHSVTVLGPQFDAALSDLDAGLARRGGFEHQIAVDLRGRTLRDRLVRRGAAELVRRLGVETPDALGYGMRQMLRVARSMPADLTIGHQEVGSWVAVRLLKEGRRVGADIEDWYSRDLTPEAQQSRPLRLLTSLERTLLRQCAHVTTTSHAMADALAEAYDAPPPTVIYNVFPWSDRASMGESRTGRDRTDRDRPSLHWVSQTIGRGRGLEAVFEALSQIETPVDVHLRGRVVEEDEAWTRRLFPTAPGHRLFLHGLVPPDELLGRIAEHNVGLALEETTPPSRDLTVTNKILHYLLGGLAVVATDTAGQREIGGQVPDAVELCTGDPVSMADALRRILAPERLEAAKTAALIAAQEQFCWEQQAPVLVASVERALDMPVGTH